MKNMLHGVWKTARLFGMIFSQYLILIRWNKFDLHIVLNFIHSIISFLRKWYNWIDKWKKYNSNFHSSENKYNPIYPHAADNTAARHIRVPHRHMSHQIFPYTTDPGSKRNFRRMTATGKFSSSFLRFNWYQFLPCEENPVPVTDWSSRRSHCNYRFVPHIVPSAVPDGW